MRAKSHEEIYKQLIKLSNEKQNYLDKEVYEKNLLEISEDIAKSIYKEKAFLKIFENFRGSGNLVYEDCIAHSEKELPKLQFLLNKVVKNKEVEDKFDQTSIKAKVSIMRDLSDAYNRNDERVRVSNARMEEEKLQKALEAENKLKYGFCYNLFKNEIIVSKGTPEPEQEDHTDPIWVYSLDTDLLQKIFNVLETGVEGASRVEAWYDNL